MDKDKKINLKKLFAGRTLSMIGIVICIAIMIFCAVGLIGGKVRITETGVLSCPATEILQQSSKEEAYRALFANIEMAEKETRYEDKLEWYSLTLLGYNALVFRKVITCSDPEMPKLEEAIRSLFVHLYIMHKRCARTNDAPELMPANFESCALMISKFKNVPKPRTPDWNNDWGIRYSDWGTRSRAPDLELY